jgi:hypothetical protein
VSCSSRRRRDEATRRSGGKPKCGKCHKPLFDGHPVELDKAGFKRHIAANAVAVVVDSWAPFTASVVAVPAVLNPGIRESTCLPARQCYPRRRGMLISAREAKPQPRSSQYCRSALTRWSLQDFKGKISIAIYVAAIALAFVHPWLACGLYVLVAAIWLCPDRRFEKLLAESKA